MTTVNSIDLSVLIASTHTRYRNFGLAIQDQVWKQVDGLSSDYRDRIEVIMVTDNKRMMLGRKRNLMVDMAQGRYVLFIDDDDRIEPDMFRTLLDATAERGLDPDVITFLASVSLNGEPPKICHYSKDFAEDRNTEEGYERIPNHICCVKRELAQKVSFPHIVYGEDSGYAKLLLPLLKTELHIPRVLYRYDYNSATSETQQRIHHSHSYPRPRQSPLVDIVIMSNAATWPLRLSTQKTIDTALSGAGMLPVNVMVLEQQDGITYRGASTMHMPDKFNYNRFANIGAEIGSAPWIVVANNDLVFHEGWLHPLLAAGHPLVSPKCPRSEKQAEIVTNTMGPGTGKHLSGWCFMISRELWDEIGGFDTCVNGWCSDDVVIQQAWQQGTAPMLVPQSIVEHAVSQTLKTRSVEEQESLTWGQLDIFIKKYGHHELQDSPGYLTWKARNGDNSGREAAKDSQHA